MKIVKLTQINDTEGLVTDIIQNIIELSVETTPFLQVVEDDLRRELTNNPALVCIDDTPESIQEHIDDYLFQSEDNKTFTYDGSDDIQFYYSLISGE